MVRIHLPPAVTQQRTLRLPGIPARALPYPVKLGRARQDASRPSDVSWRRWSAAAVTCRHWRTEAVQSQESSAVVASCPIWLAIAAPCEGDFCD